jgi:thiol-disulfide isomerase/thioredoxin|nr:TlpA disulfide reductase family protein [Kofleriaceae bacterium]
MKSFAIAVVTLALASCGQPPPPPVAPTLPAHAQISDRVHGKVAVLDFWASWCDDCRRTIPQVARLHAAYASDGLVVVGVNAGEAEPDARRSAAELGIDYDIALDPELAFSDSVGATALPTLLVVDRDGKIVHRARHVDEDTLAIIRSLLHPPPQ